jgi:hypothetical protein
MASSLLEPKDADTLGEGMVMKARFLVTVLLTALLASTVAHAKSYVTNRPAYSDSELRKLIRTAHTPEQFNALADYFGQKQQEYLQKSADEQVELDRRLAAPVISPKSPTPVDTAKRLLEYYEEKADGYGRRAYAYRLEAQRASGATASLAAH